MDELTRRRLAIARYGAGEVGRLLLAVLAMALVLVALAGGAMFVLTNTDWGRERVRRLAVTQLQKTIHGRVRVGRLEGNLLQGLTVRGLSITDSAGRPFVALDSLRGRYTLRGLLRQRIEMEDVWLYRPVVVLDKLPGQKWNWQRLFARTKPPTPNDTTPGFGSWIKLTNAHVLQGYLLAKTSWHPDPRETRAEQAASIREALAGGKRIVVVRAPGGYQKLVELVDINGLFPLVRLADPAWEMKRIDVATARLLAKPFHPPYARVEDLKGTFLIDGDSAWWRAAHVRLPRTAMVGDGRYVFENNELWLAAHADRMALADLRWAYPAFPSQGGGRGDLDLFLSDTISRYQLLRADIRTGRSRLAGDLGLTFVDTGATDTLAMHHTRLRFWSVDTRLLEQLIPGFESPVRAWMTGRAAIAGGKHAMRLADADISLFHAPTGTSRFIGGGVVGVYEKDLRARDVRLRVAPFQLPLLYTLMSDSVKTFDLPVKGAATGMVTLNGSTRQGGTVVLDVVHEDRGARSVVTGRASMDFLPVRRYDVDVNLHPLALATAGRFLPSVGLRGSAAGPLRVRGTMDDLRLSTALTLADGGRVTADGRLDISGPALGYDLAVTTRRVDLAAVVPSLPSTSLTLSATGRGRGTDPATLNGAFAVDLGPTRVDTLGVDSGVVRVRLANGLAHVDRATVHAASLAADVHGAFGLTGAHDGELVYRVSVGNLGVLHPFLPASSHPADTAVVRPRPGILAERLRRARADSARAASATEVERAATGRPAPRLVVDTPRVVRADIASGAVYAAGRLVGNIKRFDLRGRAAGENVLLHGVGAQRFMSEYAWNDALTARSKLAVGLDADSAVAMGFAFDTVAARVAYTAPTGQVQLLLRQGPERDYAMRGDFVLHPDHKELHLADVALRFDTTYWRLAQPAAVRWGGPGLVVEHLDLRNGALGRIYANGLLPTEGQANLELAVDDFDVGNALALAQSDVDFSGKLTARSVLTGTLAEPRFRGAFGLLQASYGTTPVPQLRGTFAYADRSLTGGVLVLRDTGETVLARADATIPVNLALKGVTGDRLLPGGLRVDVAADSLPLDLAARMTDAVSDVRGSLAGRVALRGTLKQPELTGGLLLRNAQARITATGATIYDLTGAVRLRGDTVSVDSLAGRAGDGTLRLTGGLAVGNWREPAFDLHLVANDAEVLHGDRGTLHVNAGIDLTGPFRRAYLAGQVTVLHGVVYIPASNNRESISAGDPAIFAVIDTSVASERELVPGQSPLLANLRMDVDVAVNRNTWVRNKDANIEVFSDGLLHAHVENEAVALTGTIASDRGEYRFLSKRFELSRGSATFVGGPELNPILQGTAEYQVQPPGREAINIQVMIGGTLQAPRISLESDAQPPLSQSDLLSYLAFGRETASLLDVEGTALSAGQGSSTLAGVSNTAGRRLAAVALGVAVDEAEGEAARQLGVDVFNVTPEEIPGGVDVGQLQGFLLGTRFEAGKYVNPRTFVAVQGSPSALQGPRSDKPKAPPGFRLEHRDSKGWRFVSSLEPRFKLREPTLRQDVNNGNVVAPTAVFGAQIVREWRF